MLIKRDASWTKAFLIKEPTQVCTSGGRTSMLMLHEILEANGGLPTNTIVSFQNTGKEVPETLDFIQECSQRWGVPIVWLEWDGFIPPGRNRCNFRIVDRESCSKKGEPFERMIDALGYLPNPTQRLCTANLKVKTGAAYMRSLGYEEWQNAMGIRADEMKRVAKLRSPNRDNDGGEPWLPLADLGVTKRHVGAFWKRMPFDLRLLNNNGTTPEGNCDLCFLKGAKSVYSLIQQRPSKADWWIEQEHKTLARGDAGACSYFRADRPSYEQMKRYAAAQIDVIDLGLDDEPMVDCMCGG